MSDDTPAETKDDIEDEQSDDKAATSIMRRHVLQASGVALTGVSLTGVASAEGDCPQVLPDVAIVNRDDQARSVSVGTASGDGISVQSRDQANVEPGQTHVIEKLPEQAEAHGARAQVAGVTSTDLDPADLGPERFRHGFQIFIDDGEAHVEVQHADLPPQEYAEILRRCDE